MERSHAVGGLTIGLLALVVAVAVAVAITAEGSGRAAPPGRNAPGADRGDVVREDGRRGRGRGGQRGRVDAGLPRRHAPADPTGWNALVCGPPAIVAGVSAALRRIWLPPAAIQAEGFG